MPARSSAPGFVTRTSAPPVFEDVTVEVPGVDGADPTTTVEHRLVGYAGYQTMTTGADGAYRFGDLLPFVQFTGKGTPTLSGDGNATDDVLALAGYRVTLPKVADGKVLAVYHATTAIRLRRWARRSTPTRSATCCAR